MGAAITALVLAGCTDSVEPPSGSPSPSASPSSPSAEPSPSAPLELSLANITVANPGNLEWSGSYRFESDNDAVTLLEEGDNPAYVPDDDYPGSGGVDLQDHWILTYEGTAAPWFDDLGEVTFSSASATGIGQDGVAMDAYLIGDGLYTYTAADGTEQAWLLTAVNTDQHSAEQRWSICRFHVAADVTVDGVLCSQAESGPAGDTWLFTDFQWSLDGDQLVESQRESWNENDADWASHEVAYAVEPGKGVLARTWPTEEPSGDVIATWSGTDQGERIPTVDEALVARGCTDDGDGGYICPDL